MFCEILAEVLGGEGVFFLLTCRGPATISCARLSL